MKSLGFHPFWPSETSHPSRGAWIEIGTGATVTTPTSRRTPHGVRGLKFDGDVLPVPSGAVAPLTGCVD